MVDERVPLACSCLSSTPHVSIKNYEKGKAAKAAKALAMARSVVQCPARGGGKVGQHGGGNAAQQALVQ